VASGAAGPRFSSSLSKTDVFQVIFFGANDACLPGTDQHVPLARYEDNIREIVGHPCVTAQGPRILLITPPPIDEYSNEITEAAKGYASRQRTAEHTKKYADACRRTGEELGLAVLDLWSSMMGKAGWDGTGPLPGSKVLPRNPVLEAFLLDGLSTRLQKFNELILTSTGQPGLHLSPEGYAFLFEEVMAIMRDRWPDQAPEALGPRFPHWTEAPA
jgi:isoamyl acetate esterase